ncbi:unnamed protein product, partial [marine sediment metagenome]
SGISQKTSKIEKGFFSYNYLHRCISRSLGLSLRQNIFQKTMQRDTLI